jgi:hypothetical protein
MEIGMEEVMVQMVQQFQLQERQIPVEVAEFQVSLLFVIQFRATRILNADFISKKNTSASSL